MFHLHVVREKTLISVRVAADKMPLRSATLTVRYRRSGPAELIYASSPATVATSAAELREVLAFSRVVAGVLQHLLSGPGCALFTGAAGCRMGLESGEGLRVVEEPA